MSTVRAIVKKELKRIFTDKRLVFTAFIMPGLLIAVIYSLLGGALDNMITETEKEVPKVYIVNVPESVNEVLTSHKDEFKATITNDTPKEGQMKDNLLSGDVKLYVMFDRQFDEKLDNYKKDKKLPSVKILYNPVDDISEKAYFSMQNVLDDYKNKIVGLRLGDKDYLNVYKQKVTEIKDEKKEAGEGISMLLPFLISIFLFAGAMQIGMDSIAGEKERGTMALLLLTPVKRSGIAAGKIISLGIVALMSACSSFIGVVISLPRASYMYGGPVDINNLRYGVGDILQLAVVIIFLTGIYVSLICLMSVLAKNVKEAGAMVTPVYILIMVIGMLTMFTGQGTPELYKFAIPVYGNIMCIKSILVFELTAGKILLTILTSLILISLLVYIIGKCFKSERIMIKR